MADEQTMYPPQLANLLREDAQRLRTAAAAAEAGATLLAWAAQQVVALGKERDEARARVAELEGEYLIGVRR
jgi:hypothetical protein